MTARRQLRAGMVCACALALFLLCAFASLDLAGARAQGSAVKYVAIVCCLLAACALEPPDGDGLIPIALLFTVGADTCLLLLDRYYPLGVALFCVVQGMYALRLRRAGARGDGRRGLLIFLVIAGAGTAMGLGVPLSALLGVYLALFLGNLLGASRLEGVGGRLFLAGLALYFCCDLCVGLARLALPDGSWQGLYLFWVWLYYLPGKLLIVLSGRYPLHKSGFAEVQGNETE